MTTFTPRKKKTLLKYKTMTKVKVKKKEVATLVARCLLEQIGGKNERGLQRKIRQGFNVHGKYFSKEHADKLSKEHYAEIVGAITAIKSRADFRRFWMEYGEQLYDTINENEENFFC